MMTREQVLEQLELTDDVLHPGRFSVYAQKIAQHDAEQRQTIATLTEQLFAAQQAALSEGVRAGFQAALTERVRELEAQSNYWQMAFEEKRDAYQCTQQKIADLEAELARVKGAV